MIEKPSVGRAIITKDYNSLNIEIPSKKNWIIIIFLSAWMGGWVMGESFALGQIFNFDSPIFANAFIFFWLIGWTVGGAFVLYIILWQLIGREKISIDRGIIKLERSVKGIGRKKEYDINSITNIDINPTMDSGIFSNSYNRDLLGMKGGKIKFDYGMKTIKFARDINEAEAKIIIELLRKNTNFKEENFAVNPN